VVLFSHKHWHLVMAMKQWGFGFRKNSEVFGSISSYQYYCTLYSCRKTSHILNLCFNYIFIKCIILKCQVKNV
jgi:hypothetical protein